MTKDTMTAQEYRNRKAGNKKETKAIPVFQPDHVLVEANGKITITLGGLPQTLNDMLKKNMWFKKGKIKQAYIWRIRSLFVNLPKYTKQVTLTYTRIGAREVDQDNLAGESKIIIDSIKELKMIVDDSPTWMQLKTAQEKCKRVEQRVKIEIQEV